MANFINPEGLLKLGENLYEESDGSGTCQTSVARANGFGKIRQGWIEKSNVDLRQEIAEWKRIRQACRTIRTLMEGNQVDFTSLFLPTEDLQPTFFGGYRPVSLDGPWLAG